MEGLRQTVGGGGAEERGGSESREENRSLSCLTESTQTPYEIIGLHTRACSHISMRYKMTLWGTTSSLGQIHYRAVKCKVDYVALNVNT